MISYSTEMEERNMIDYKRAEYRLIRLDEEVLKLIRERGQYSGKKTESPNLLLRRIFGIPLRPRGRPRKKRPA